MQRGYGRGYDDLPKRLGKACPYPLAEVLLCERLGWSVTPFDLQTGPLREQPADTLLYVQGILGVFEEQKAKSERRMMRRQRKRRRR